MNGKTRLPGEERSGTPELWAEYQAIHHQYKSLETELLPDLGKIGTEKFLQAISDIKTASPEKQRLAMQVMELRLLLCTKKYQGVPKEHEMVRICWSPRAIANNALSALRPPKEGPELSGSRSPQPRT
jgi:hypothetical protein